MILSSGARGAPQMSQVSLLENRLILFLFYTIDKIIISPSDGLFTIDRVYGII